MFVRGLAGLGAPVDVLVLLTPIPVAPGDSPALVSAKSALNAEIASVGSFLMAQGGNPETGGSASNIQDALNKAGIAPSDESLLLALRNAVYATQGLPTIANYAQPPGAPCNAALVDSFTSQLRAAWPFTWDIQGIDRARELAELLVFNGVKSFGDGFHVKTNYSDPLSVLVGANAYPSFAGYGIQLSVGGATIGYLGDVNDDNTCGTNRDVQSVRYPLDQYPIVAFSATGHGHVTFVMVRDPSGATDRAVIYPTWGSSSDANQIQAELKFAGSFLFAAFGVAAAVGQAASTAAAAAGASEGVATAAGVAAQVGTQAAFTAATGGDVSAESLLKSTVSAYASTPDTPATSGAPMGDDFDFDLGTAADVLPDADVADIFGSGGFDFSGISFGDTSGSLTDVFSGNALTTTVDPGSAAIPPESPASSAGTYNPTTGVSSGISASTIANLTAVALTGLKALSAWNAGGQQALQTPGVTRTANGSIVAPSKNGTLITTAPNGLVSTSAMPVGKPYLFSDGSIVTNNGDGTYTTVQPNGSTTIAAYPQGLLSGISGNTLLIGGAAVLALLLLMK